MKILFICSANKDRSVTAEEYAQLYWPQHEYDSAGTNQKICFQLGTQYIDAAQLDWADLIFCMENKHQTEIQRIFSQAYNSKISVLHINDRYAYNSSELKEILVEKLKEYLE